MSETVTLTAAKKLYIHTLASCDIFSTRRYANDGLRLRISGDRVKAGDRFSVFFCTYT